MKTLKDILLGFVVLVLTNSCGTFGFIFEGTVFPVPEQSPPPPPRQQAVYPSYKDLHIPKGHLPSPGSCKVWFPNKPAGQQPAPTDCHNAMRNSPAGSWVLTRKPDNPGLLVVRRILSSHPLEFEESYYIVENP